MLGPLADTDADLQVVMAYRYPGDETRGAVELFPISGKKATAAAQAAGLAPAGIPALLVEGSNKAGIGFEATNAIAAAGINLAFLVAQVNWVEVLLGVWVRQRGRSSQSREAVEEGDAQTVIDHSRALTATPSRVDGHANCADSYCLRRYASNAGRSSAVTNPRSTTSPSDERIGGRFGGGFKRAARLKNAS